jgi:hypothetical protein
MAAAAAIAFAVLVPMQFANATETGTYENGAGPAGVTIPQGTITLRMNPVADATGSKAYFRYMAPDGTTQKAIQTFKQSGKCSYALNTTPANIVDVRSSGGPVGFLEKDNGWGLGVNKNGNEGAGGCTQVNPGESLTLDFRPGLPAGSFLDFSVLDMELKYTNTILTIALYKGEISPTNPNQNKVYTYIRTCDASDCSPDSGGNDNKPVRVPLLTNDGIDNDTVLFNQMVITATLNGGQQAAATLEGGSDPGVPGPSTFDVVTPATPIQCETPVSPDVPPGATDATVTFLTDPVTGCPTGKAYALTVATKKIELFLGGASTHIQALVESDWAVEPAPPARVLVSPCTPGVGDCNPNTLEETEVWCNGVYNEEDAWDPVDNPGGTFGASMPPGHFWCRITEETKIAGDGLVQQKQLSLSIGDPYRGK